MDMLFEGHAVVVGVAEGRPGQSVGRLRQS